MDPKSLLSGLNLDSKGFKQLLDTQSLVDCTLACDGGKISAHKIVLSSCSSYLADIFIKHPVEHPIIILPELNIEDVKTLVHYMYTGELLKSDTLHSTSLLKTAGVLSVNSLTEFLDEDNKDTSIEPHHQQTFVNATSTTTTNQHSSKSDFQFRCSVCQSDFQTICSFEYHMQRIHNVTSFGCEICHKPFASLRYVLTDHMRRCHGWKAEQKLQY